MDFTWDKETPLARQKGERRNAWEALRDYVRMGPGRSLPKLARGYRGEYTPDDDPLYYEFFKRYVLGDCGENGENPPEIPPTASQRTLESWSAKYAWQARLDAYLDQLEAARAERQRERRAEIEDRDYRDGQFLRQRVLEILAEMDEFITFHVETEEEERDDGTVIIKTTVFKALDTTITQAATALKTASDLQRLAAGVSTSNQRMVDEEGHDVLPVMGIEVVNPFTAAQDPDGDEEGSE